MIWDIGSPPKMPGIRAVDVPLKDARAAIDRAIAAWRKEQVLEAIQAAERYLEEARKHLE